MSTYVGFRGSTYSTSSISLQGGARPALGSGFTIASVKAVRFGYAQTSQIRALLETFREMVNDAIRISLSEDIHGRLTLRNRIYKEFQTRYGVMSRYPYSVAEVAWSIVKKHKKWNRKPVAKRLMLKMDAENYSLNHSILSLPCTPGRRILIPLLYGDYQRNFLGNTDLKRGSVTITDSAVMIAYTKRTPVTQSASRVGIDINQRRVVSSDGAEYNLSEVMRLHAEYGIRRTRFQKKHNKDERVKRKFISSRRERARIGHFLHVVAKQIVEAAKTQNESIMLENLKGINKPQRKHDRNGEGRRRRMSQWPFRMLQNLITYKAGWEGIKVEFVNPSLTSKTCHFCGHIKRELKLSEREWRCPSCGAILDRDLNAAVNIERRGTMPCLGEVRPGAQGIDEAVKGNEAATAPILRAEAQKPRVRGVPP